MMEKKLLQRYIEGNVSEKEVEDVMTWLDEDGENVRELNALHRLYDISLLNRSSIMNVEKSKGRSKWKGAIIELVKVAAIFIAVYAGIHLWDKDGTKGDRNTVTWQTLFVPPGQRAELILSDSTKIWVNAQSKILYPSSFEKGKREVILYGEAYFDVRHRAEMPFIVKTNTADIEVKGTEFNVIADSARTMFAVSLLKGSIELTLASNKQSILMRPNEHLELKDGKLKLSHISDFDYFRWKEGLLCFNNETVGAIIEKLQLYYDVKIDVNKSNLLQYRYSGKFRTKDGVEQVLRVLQLEHRFSYIKDNELNLITIK